MREDERTKKLQPFLQYLNQTPAAELMNDYTYQLAILGDPDEQITRLQYLQNVVTAPGTGIKWEQFDVWRAGCAKRMADDPAAFYDSADRWHDLHYGKPPAPECMENIKGAQAEWLVPDLIPLGDITLLGADGGTGKGIWQAQLIAYVTTGKTSGFFPVPPPKIGKVLILSGEDDPAKTLKGRSMAAGADTSKILVITSDEYYTQTGNILTVKSKDLERFVDTSEPILLILDPLQSFLPADVEMASRSQMRGSTLPLRAISSKRNLSTLIAMHTNKKQGVSGRARLADSSDIWDIARSVLMMGAERNTGKIYVSHEKSNYSKKQQTVLMHIEGVKVDGLKTERAIFDGYTDKKDADFIEERKFRQAQTKDDTRDAILNVLAESHTASMESAQLKSAVMQEIGCSEPTYKRAYADLVKSGEVTKRTIRQKDGKNKWYSFLYCGETDDTIQK